MDELELLKKDWQKDNKDYPKLTQKDIFPMLLKKSSSIVKILLYISIAELILWVFINIIPFFLPKKDSSSQINPVDISKGFGLTITIFSTLIIILFVYLLFRSYRSISVIDSSKKLMENILKTRRTVKQYVGFNIILMVISVIYVLSTEFQTNPAFIGDVSNAAADGEIFKFYAISFIVIVLVLAICLGILILVYWLIYGLLLKKLNNNYKELKKLEI